MVFLDWKELPWYWHGFEHFRFAVAMALVVPGAARAGVRLLRVPLAHPRRLLLDRHAGADLRGDAAVLPERHRLRRQQRPHRLQAHPRLPAARPGDASSRSTSSSAIALLLAYLLCRFIVTSKLGRVLTAIRDAELKTRFCGYDSTHYKLFVWTLSAMLCGAGRRALRAAGRHHQPQRDAARRTRSRWRSGWRSAGAARWSARVLGAWLVNGGKSWLTAAFPSAWLYVLGALFVVVTLFLPRGPGRAARARRAGGARAPGGAGAVDGARSTARRRSRRAPRPSGPTAATRARASPSAPHRATTAPTAPRQRHAAADSSLWVENVTRQLRRLQGARRPHAAARAGRAALHHRPQRRRQDHADGRDHRQDAARQRRAST